MKKNIAIIGGRWQLNSRDEKINYILKKVLEKNE